MATEPMLVADIRSMWGNGSRGLMIAFLGFLASLALLASLGVWAYVALQDDTYTPLDYKNPQRVVNRILHNGDKLIVDGIKCNTTDEDVPVAPITIDGNAYIRNLDTNELIPRGGKRIDGAVRVPGCVTLHFENTLPHLEPGRYWLEGIDTATRVNNDGSVQTQNEGWHTESFEVLPDAVEGVP